MNNLNLEIYFTNQKIISSFALKRKLFKSKVKEMKCEECLSTEWMGQIIPLELHHKDGNNKNNNLDNLQILCPNCHALTPNFCSRKDSQKVRKKLSEEEYVNAIKNSINARQACILLGITAYGANYERIYKIRNKYNINFREKTTEEINELKEKMSKAYFQRTNKVQTIKIKKGTYRKVKNRPAKELLFKLVWERSVSSLAKEYGVSDNAIRKWAARYNIPIPPVGYWRKLVCGYIEECEKIKKKLFEKFKIITNLDSQEKVNEPNHEKLVQLF